VLGVRKVGSMKVESIRDLDKLIDKFLSDVFAEFDFDLDLEKPIKIYDYEFNDLIGYYDSSNGVVNDGIFDDEYSYYLLPEEIGGRCKEITKRLYIKYEKDEDENYIIHHISGITEIADCEDP
jgi:hypothetical protein